MKIEPLSEEHLAQLNPGIRHTVATLRGWGFDTRDSGDGSTAQFECDLEYPYVHISVAEGCTLFAEMSRIKTLLRECEGVEVGMCNEAGDAPTIEGCILADGSAWIHLFNVVIPERSTSPSPGSTD